jgi:aspartyl-tRNA(Asn)/glutamyl-tRNA(Gln) amidotransferase subunit C
MDLDLARLRHIAELAELSLSEAEEARLPAEIGRILAYVAELEGVDTTGVPESAHVGSLTPLRSGDGWREDVPRDGLSHEDALSGAPGATPVGFAVPGFVE